VQAKYLKNERIEAAKREKQLKGWNKAKKQLLIDGKLGFNICTGFAEALLRSENL
jgi:predicted GIY-YIG superfamily endonuclease